MSRLQVARCHEGWAIFDEEAAKIVYRGPSPESYFMSMVRQWLSDPPPQMTYLEMRIRAGEIACMVCNSSVEVEAYNVRAPESRQLCKKCKEA